MSYTGNVVLSVEGVAKAPSDGYTLLIYAATLWVAPLLGPVPYDAMRDFAPITLATRAPNMLVVHPSVPAKMVKELVALAKARPGMLNYGSTPGAAIKADLDRMAKLIREAGIRAE